MWPGQRYSTYGIQITSTPARPVGIHYSLCRPDRPTGRHKITTIRRRASQLTGVGGEGGEAAWGGEVGAMERVGKGASRGKSPVDCVYVSEGRRQDCSDVIGVSKQCNI